MKKKDVKKEPINIDNLKILDTSDLLKDISILCGPDDDFQVDIPDEEGEKFAYSEDWLQHHGFWEEQIQEIRKGHEQQLPVERYAKDCYNWMQMREIRLGLEAGVHTVLYEDPHFEAQQMREIRRGLEEGLDVSLYAKLSCSPKDMVRIRKSLEEEAYSVHPWGYAKTIEDEESGMRIRISDDCMEAYASFSKDPGLTVGEIKRILKRYGIVFGVLDKSVSEIFAQQRWNREIKIAQGQKAKTGANGRYEFFFNPLLPGKPRELEDGSVDYTEIAEVDRVNAGEKLAQYHSAQPGKDGATVTGIPIHGKAGQEFLPLTGQGFVRNEEGNLYTATMDGFAFADVEARTLNVWNVFVVPGDVNRYTGHITYDGIIHIKGNVGDMSVINATGNIVVEGIVEGAASLIAGKNVILKNGMNGGEKGIISAGRKVMGKFFEGVHITAGDDVEGNYFMNCQVKTDGHLIAKGRKGRIIGGYLKALGGVEAVSIGNNNLTRTTLDVGDAIQVEEKRREAVTKLERIENDLFQLEMGKRKLIQIMGETLAPTNTLYKKTSKAIDAMEDQKLEVENYIHYINHLVKRAAQAEIIVHGSLQDGVRVIMGGRQKDVPHSSGRKIIIKRESKGV